MKKLAVLVALLLLVSALAPAMALAEGGKVTVRINLQSGVGVAEAWAAVEQGYEALHPEVDVIVDLKPDEGYADWVKAQFASDNPEADIVAINLAGPAAANKDINFYEYAFDDSPYSDGEWNEQFNFTMQNRNTATAEWNNLSLQSVQVLWFYNRAIFDEVGVQPPSNWDELIEVCDKIAAAGYQPLAVAGDFNSFWAGQMGWLAQMYVDQTTRDQIEIVKAQEGDYCYDDDIDPNFQYDPTDPWNDDSQNVTQNPLRYWQAFRDGKVTADSAGIKKVMENFAKVFPKYAGGENFYGTANALPLFMQGKAAMIVDGGWRLTEFKRDMDSLKAGKEIMSGETVIEDAQIFELGAFNMPSMQGPEFLAPARTIEVAVGFLGAISKDKAHDDQVVDFLMYYSSAEGYSAFLSAGIANGMGVNGPALVNGVKLPGDYQAMFDNLSFIGNCQKGFGQALARGIGDNQEALRAWYGYSMDLLNGKIDIDTWGAMHQENQMKYLPEVLKAGKMNPSDLDNPQNAPTGE
ncbi:MAG: extracellular solute-binding protein [Clostridiales bacterium]|nr:extracellular solute-binding protein [Clostridiales bacterium]